jgi:type VI secretion system protein ImpI
MALTLRIDNQTSLPDGGPLSVTIRGKRGIDIGRDSHLDWTLPDPTRFISGKHCEIRYKDGGYWLHDVSTNGTFLNGADHRMQAPYQLRNGDRFVIGDYVVAATVEEDGPAEAGASQGAAPATARSINYQELWANEGQVAPSIDAKQLKSADINPSVRSDFLDRAVDVPDPVRVPPPLSVADRSAEPNADPDMDWAYGPSQAPTPAPAPARTPAPRRAAQKGNAGNPWEEASSTVEAAEPLAQPAPAAKIPPASSANPIAPLAGGLRSSEEFLRQLAGSAGLPDDLFRQKDPAEFAQQLGVVLRIVVENLMQLLSARAQAKRLARSSNHTVVQATENNPLKFAHSANEAMRIMLGPATQSYLNPQRAIEQSFEDLKNHQLKTYSAMQHALRMLMADLEPQAIEQDSESVRGIARLLTSRGGRLWEAYRSRWDAKVGRSGNGPVDAFMLYFAEYYERDGGEAP